MDVFYRRRIQIQCFCDDRGGVAPYLTMAAIADVYVDRQSIAGLEAAVTIVDLRPIEGGRFTLRPFPTVAAKRPTMVKIGVTLAAYSPICALSVFEARRPLSTSGRRFFVAAEMPLRSRTAREAAEQAHVRIVHHCGERPEFVLLRGLIPELPCAESGFRRAGTTEMDVQVDLEIAYGAVHVPRSRECFTMPGSYPTTAASGAGSRAGRLWRQS